MADKSNGGGHLIVYTTDTLDTADTDEYADELMTFDGFKIATVMQFQQWLMYCACVPDNWVRGD
jgi:hypothetical protein